MESEEVVRVNTFIRRGLAEGRFIPLDAWIPDDAEDDFDDISDLEGAIEVVCAGTVVMRKDDWDFLYALWVTIAERFEEFRATGCMVVGFMDQPREFKCKKVRRNRVEVSYGREGAVEGRWLTRAEVDLRAFFRALLTEADHFFRRLHELSLIPSEELKEVEAQIRSFDEHMELGLSED